MAVSKCILCGENDVEEGDTCKDCLSKERLRRGEAKKRKKERRKRRI